MSWQNRLKLRSKINEIEEEIYKELHGFAGMQVRGSVLDNLYKLTMILSALKNIKMEVSREQGR